MKFWTYAELKNKVQKDLDLQDETFITEDEMLSYANESIDVVESEIHKLGGEDEYYLTKDTLNLTVGVSTYDLPSDIYATKFRRILHYIPSEDKPYTVERFRGSKKFELIADAEDDDDLQYILTNSSADGFKQVFAPPPREANSYMERWYIRNAAELVDDSSVCDIPECGVQYVLAYMKEQCLAKENQGIAPIEAQKKTLDAKALMIETLSEMVPDGDNTVELDMSHYWEHV